MTDAEFSQMMEEMASHPHWTLKTWGETLEEQLRAWDVHVTGPKVAPEVLEMRMFKGENTLKRINSYVAISLWFIAQSIRVLSLSSTLPVACLPLVIPPTDMLTFMTAQEKDDVDLITDASKDRVAKATGRTVEQVESLLHVYKQTLIVYTYLQEK